MFATALTILLSASAVFFFIMILIDIRRTKPVIHQEKGSMIGLAAAEIVTWFLASFGVSDTAMHMLIFRVRKTVAVEQLPGAIIVCATVPLCVMSAAYVHASSVDTMTCGLLIAAQAVGSFIGAKYVVRLNVARLRLVMAGALIGTAALILANLFLFRAEGGSASVLPIRWLIVACAVFFTLGAFNMVGLGPMSINIAMLLLLGMDPANVFPIVMSASAIGCLAGCYRFIKSGRYHRKAALASASFGLVGVLIAVRFAHAVDVAMLQLLMVAVLIYGAVSILRSASAPAEIPAPVTAPPQSLL